MQVVDVAGLRPVDTYVMRIRAAYARSVESIIAIGRELIEARKTLRHGEFERMCRSRLPFKARTAQMYMRIARHPRLANPQVWGRLLASLATLDFLAGLDDELLELALSGEGIGPDQSEFEVRLSIDCIAARLRASTQTSPAAAVPLGSATIVRMPPRVAGPPDALAGRTEERSGRSHAQAGTLAGVPALVRPGPSAQRVSDAAPQSDDLHRLAFDAIAHIERQLARKVVDVEGSIHLIERWRRLTASVG